MRQLSAHVRQETTAIKERQQQKVERANTNAKRLKKLGLSESFARAGDEFVSEGAEMMLRAKQRHTEGRDYALDPDKKFIPKGESK